MQSMEDILETNLINNLSYIYGKDDNLTIMHILYLRALAYYDKKSIDSEELSNFVMIELNLPKPLIFNGVEISLSYRYDNNCLLNIMDNLLYRYIETYYNDVKKGLVLGKDILGDLFTKLSKTSKAKTRAIKYQNKNYVYKSILFTLICKEFNVEIKPFKMFERYSYNNSHNEFKRTLDEEYNYYYNDYITNKGKIEERHLEDYIFKNGLDNIKILQRQYKTKNGIIDMLGTDEDKKIVAIELKVVPKPRDLLWQINLYKNDLLEKYTEDKIRMIIVSPKLNDSVKKLLPKFCELYEFKKNKDNFTFKKVL